MRLHLFSIGATSTSRLLALSSSSTHLCLSDWQQHEVSSSTIYHALATPVITTVENAPQQITARNPAENSGFVDRCQTWMRYYSVICF